MSPKSPAFQFYPDKWQTDTRRLSWKTKGIYHEAMCVVWLQYQKTCCLPNDDEFIASELGCTTEDWMDAKSELLNPHRPILSINQETNSLFFNGLAKERDKQMDRREKLRQNGLQGGRPKNQKVISEEPKQKPGTGNQNESLPSPSPSPSPFNVYEEIDSRIGALFGRTGPAATYSEQSSISEISRRPEALAEIAEIEAFHRKPGNYFPQSLQKLLSTWQETLDRARTYDKRKNNHEADKRIGEKRIDMAEGTLMDGKASQYRGVGKVLSVRDAG